MLKQICCLGRDLSYNFRLTHPVRKTVRHRQLGDIGHPVCSKTLRVLQHIQYSHSCSCMSRVVPASIPYSTDLSSSGQDCFGSLCLRVGCDVVYCVCCAQDLVSLAVRDLHCKFLLKRHDDLHCVQAVQPEIFLEARRWGHLFSKNTDKNCKQLANVLVISLCDCHLESNAEYDI